MVEKRSSKGELRAAESAKGWSSKFAYPVAFDQEGVGCWTRGMSAFAEEMTHFVQARWQNDMETWAKLTTCRNPNDALECQQRYTEKALADYLDEFGKLSRLAMGTATEAFSAFREQGGMASSAKAAEAA